MKIERSVLLQHHISCKRKEQYPFELFLDFARHILAIKVPLMQKYLGYKHSIFVDKNNNNNNNKRKVILDSIASD